MNQRNVTTLMMIVYLLSLTTYLQAAQSRNHRMSDKDRSKLVTPFKEWMIGANKKGVVDAVLVSGANNTSFYNLKNSEKKKFFQYEKQGTARGINLGWTDNASAKTAIKRALWVFVPKIKNRNDRGSVLRNKPIKYGETIAIAWVKPGKSAAWNSKINFIKLNKRNVGINLDWSDRPAYEWTILGGKPGTEVRRGVDKVVIYNIRKKQPLVYYPRKVGGQIGWAEKNAGNLPGGGVVVKRRKMPDLNVWKGLMMDDTKKAVSRN